MDIAKLMSTTLGHFKLSKEFGAKTNEEKEEMEKVSYSLAIRSLVYNMISTRPDIAHVMGVMSRFISNPRKEHWQTMKWIFGYLRGTSKGSDNIDVRYYVDSDHGNDRDNGRSTTRYIFTIGGKTVSRISKLQKVVLPSTKAEYMVGNETSKEFIWIQ